jgi:predicted Fe-S protein YdhL (DUF1289 family)
VTERALIRSPCIRVCAVDGAKGLCVGCGRTLKEIARWTTFTDAEREAICEALPQRLAAALATPPRA